MLVTPAPIRPGSLGRAVLLAVLLVLVAPVGMFAAPGPALQASAGLLALPFAALCLFAPPRRPLAVAGAALALLLAAWWLAAAGGVLDQTVRAAAVFTAAVFLILGVATRWSLTHRILTAVAAATLAVAALFAVIGRTWQGLHWWSEYRAGYAMRLRFAALWDTGTASDPLTREMGEIINASVGVLADLFPALLALHLAAACAVAAVLHTRLTGGSVGTPGGPFRTFRFSEHLGWLMVAPLAAVLLVKLSVVKLAAWNLLTVMGALYALRGLAVAAVGFQVLGGGVFLAVLAALAVVFMLPVTLGTALVLGVLDSGLDLRRRWTTPPRGK